MVGVGRAVMPSPFSLLKDLSSPSSSSCFGSVWYLSMLEKRERRWLHSQTRSIPRVRLKWVKNRALDHVIDRDTDLKAACLLKDAISRSSHGFLSARFLSDKQKLLGLTVPVLRFLRRYPSLFSESLHPQYSHLPCFRLSDTALFLHAHELSLHLSSEALAVERLSRLLMLSRPHSIPLHSLLPLQFDLGLPPDFIKSLVPKYPDHFHIDRRHDGLPCLTLSRWHDEFAVSHLQKHSENTSFSIVPGASHYRNFKKGASLAFPMNFPRGYGAQKKVVAWMDAFQNLPYVSPYEDSSQIDPDSDLMEKRVVGVLHELLSLMVHKKTKRNYIRKLRLELNLPHRFTRIFTRYPGVFYLSLKCKTTTIVLKEGYQRGKLIDPSPLVRWRDKFYYIMRTGVMYRGKGLEEYIYNKGDPDGFHENQVSSDHNSEEDDEEECDIDASDFDADSSSEE